MNRIRDASAGLAWSIMEGMDTTDLQNLYHPLFGYNFVNGGNSQHITCQTDGFKLLQSIGCPMYNYYYNNLLEGTDYGSLKAKYWMSSHDGYADVIRQKVDSIYQIQFNPSIYSTFETLKHWLYDHNEGEGSFGGLASIAVLTGGDSTTFLQNGDAIYYRLGNDPSTGHVITIVGYDDAICYDLNGNNLIEQDEYGAFRVVNTWDTTAWGHNGFAWLPYKLMGDLQNHRHMAFCCTVKECEPTVYVKGTWVHPHQYMRRMDFKFAIGTRMYSNMSFGDYSYYPIFYRQGGYNSLQGINYEDTLAFCLDYGNYHQGMNHVGRYFIDAYNHSGTSGNKLLGLTLVDCRWNEVFELPFDEDTVEIDTHETVVDIKYDLIPFGPLGSISYNRELVTRRTVTLSGNAIVTMNKPTIVNMYGTDLFDSEIIVGENASLQLTDSVQIIAKRGDCRIIVRGTLTIGNGVVFEARDGATLEIIFENDADLAISDATFINCTLELPNRNLSFNNCHFLGTPLVMDNTVPQSAANEITSVITNCVFSPNGSNINNALYIKNFAHYKVIGCKIETNDGGIFKNGIAIYNCGSNSGLKLVHGNDVSGCLQAGIQMYASAGSITKNTIYGNGYGIKLLNNCNISSLSGNCGADLESDTQFIYDNTNNEIYMTGSSIPQRFRYNAIHHNGNTPFVYHDAYIAFGGGGELPARGPIDVKYNYWGNGFSPSIHLYTSLDEGTYEYNPEWILGNCYNEWVDATMLLNEADSLNDAGAYSEAQLVYKQVINNYPETVSAETALKSLLSLEAQLEGDYLSLKEYYQTNSTIDADETLSHLASSLANKSDEKMGNFAEAIEWYEEALTNPETSFNDSIFAAIDLGDLYLKIEANGGKGMCGKLKQYVPKSMQTHKNQTDYALSLLPYEKANSTETMNVNNNVPPVSNLNSQVLDNDTIFLSWSVPPEADEVVVSWSNMIDRGDWGVAAGQCATDQAARFDTDDLVGFVGWRIKDVSVILSYSDTTSGMQDQNYYIRIWKGTNNELEQIYEKEIIQPIYSVPLTVSVDSDVFVDDKDLWIGYYIDKYRMYPWIMDDVPVAPQGKGFYYRLYHKDFNEDCIVGQNWGNDWPYSTGNLCVASTLVSPEREYGKMSLTAPLTGYRIYRNGTFIKEIPYSFVTHYTDTEFTKGIDVEYCVTAVYGDEESEPVCATATITGVNEVGNDGIIVSPNPTSGIVRIEGVAATKVQVYNALVQLVKAFNDTNEINLKGMPQGMYLLQITDESGTIVTRKIVVE